MPFSSLASELSRRSSNDFPTKQAYFSSDTKSTIVGQKQHLETASYTWNNNCCTVVRKLYELPSCCNITAMQPRGIHQQHNTLLPRKHETVPEAHLPNTPSRRVYGMFRLVWFRNNTNKYNIVQPAWIPLIEGDCSQLGQRAFSFLTPSSFFRFQPVLAAINQITNAWTTHAWKCRGQLRSTANVPLEIMSRLWNARNDCRTWKSKADRSRQACA